MEKTHLFSAIENLDHPLRYAVRQAESNIRNLVLGNVQQGIQDFFLTRKKYQVAEDDANKPSIVETNIRKKKFNDAAKMKAELEKKLKFINEELNVIGSDDSEFASQTIRQKLLTRETRKQQKIKEKKKEDEAKELAEMLRYEQRERKARQRKQRRDEQLALQEELKQKEALEAEKAKKAQEDKKKQLEEIQFKAQKRRSDMDRMFSLKSHNAAKHPLHVKMENRFIKSSLTPDLDVKKTTLQYLRQSLEVNNKREIIGHQHRYDEFVISEDERRRKEMSRLRKRLHCNSVNTYRSELYMSTQQEYMKKRKLSDDMTEMKKSLKNRHLQYDAIVKDLHGPELDEEKAKQVERIKDRLKHPSKPKVYDEGTTFPRRPFPKPIESPAPPPRINHSIDFLAERRARREAMGKRHISGKIKVDHLSADSKLEEFQKQARRREQEITWKQSLLSDGSAPMSLDEIEKNDSVNTDITNNIRAKLKMINEN